MGQLVCFEEVAHLHVGLHKIRPTVAQSVVQHVLPVNATCVGARGVDVVAALGRVVAGKGQG